MGQLNGKTALVTGGAAGFGKAIAQRLAADGARVVITDVQSEAGQRTADEGGFIFLQQDVRDEAQWAEIIREVEDRCGRLDILVNNAGVAGMGSPEDATLEEWRRIFSVNADAVFLGCRAAIPAMRRAGGGSIVNISSISGLTATPSVMAYGASKAVVRQLTKSVAQHCAEQKLNIRCNSVHPGVILTPMVEKYAQDLSEQRGQPIEAVLEEFRNDAPLGEMPVPSDVAAAVAFLASDDSRHMTGAKLIVDSGYVECDTFRRRRAIASTTRG